HMLDLQRNPILDRRQWVTDDMQRRRQRIDFDLRPHDDIPKIEWARLRGIQDREPKRRALIGAGDEDLAAFDRERRVPKPSADDRMADRAPRRARTRRSLWFGTQFDVREIA